MYFYTWKSYKIQKRKHGLVQIFKNKISLQSLCPRDSLALSTILTTLLNVTKRIMFTIFLVVALHIAMLPYNIIRCFHIATRFYLFNNFVTLDQIFQVQKLVCNWKTLNILFLEKYESFTTLSNCQEAVIYLANILKVLWLK